MNSEIILERGFPMIELFQLEQLTAFADYKTLSKAAEMLHMSQPTLTRSMQKLESEFDVSLFRRTKNKLELNENGELAVSFARKLLEEADNMVYRVRSFDRAKHTISIGSCAPMPLLDFVRKASQICPDKTITSQLSKNETLLRGLYDDTYQMIILPFSPEDDHLYIKECGKESLFFALPKNHPLADRKGLYMEELDGENMLLYSNIGFWHDIPIQKMPHSRFLIQNERFAFEELAQSSILPFFVSDVTLRSDGPPKDRIVVPILDTEASVTYFAVCKTSSHEKLSCLF